jgi:rhodanese-related sulfurtransferase
MPCDVERDEVQRLIRDGAVLIEAMPSGEYEAEHIPGAINVPLKELDAEHLARFERDRPTVVYCNDFQ